MYSTVVAPTAHSLLLFAPRCSALMTATEMPTADTANFDNCIQFSTAIRSIRYEWIENPLIFTSSLTHQRNWLRVSYKCLEKSFSPSLPSSQAFFGCVARTHDCLLVATVEHICLVGVWCVYTWVYTEQAHTHRVPSRARRPQTPWNIRLQTRTCIRYSPLNSVRLLFD